MNECIVICVSFEVEERVLASKRLEKALSMNKPEISYAAKSYLTGLNLMGLEDQFPGLLEAAFMQFYIGCETICETHKCDKAKEYISKNVSDPSESRRLQIIAHQVWEVRNTYYGHSAETKNKLPANYEESLRVAKQVLVARYLCKRLLELSVPERDVLVREMGLFGDDYVRFDGSIEQLQGKFWVPFHQTTANIYVSGKIDKSQEFHFVKK